MRTKTRILKTDVEIHRNYKTIKLLPSLTDPDKVFLYRVYKKEVQEVVLQKLGNSWFVNQMLWKDEVKAILDYLRINEEQLRVSPDNNQLIYLHLEEKSFDSRSNSFNLYQLNRKGLPIKKGGQNLF